MAKPKGKWWSDQQVADHYNVNRATIWNWAKSKPGFPQPVKVGGNTTRFDGDAIAAYDESLAA
nr:helix-turn-helix domain-containing protein [uncultured Ruegeria sp.]